MKSQNVVRYNFTHLRRSSLALKGNGLPAERALVVDKHSCFDSIEEETQHHA